MNKGLLILFAIFIGLSAWYFVDSTFHTQGPPAMLVSQSPTDSAKLHAEGLRLFHQGKLKEAIDSWLQELKLDPQNANAYNNIGMAYKELGDFTNSVKYHLKAVELAPNFGHGYYSLGIVYFESELYDQSAKAFQKSIELEFKPADSYYYLGHIYKDSQQCAKAIEAYKKAVELQPAYEIYIKSYKESCEKYLAESNAFRILTIERCCSADFDCADRKTDEFCITDNVAPGRSITILMDKNQLCFAKTGEHSVIITDIGETPGTALTDVVCKSLNDGAIAVVNEVVKDHEKLELREIKDATLISALEGKIETGGLLDNFKIQEDGRQYLPKSATIYQYPYPGRKVFFVLYDPQPLILMNNDIYDLLSGSRECLGSKLISAFKVNKRYYVQVLRCACETDACGDEFVEIKSN